MMCANNRFTPTVSSVSVRADLSQKRARIYGVLGAAYTRPADDALIEAVHSWVRVRTDLPGTILTEVMIRGLREVSVWFEQSQFMSNDERLATLESEYVRLFQGSMRESLLPSPRESVYVDSGFLFGQSTDKVRKKYQQFDLTEHERINEPPDHLAMELEFMSFLCTEEASAWRLWEAVRSWLEEESVFLNHHLMRWVSAFCANVREFSNSPFYTGLADITDGWIHYDRKIIKDSWDQEARVLV